MSKQRKAWAWVGLLMLPLWSAQAVPNLPEMLPVWPNSANSITKSSLVMNDKLQIPDTLTPELYHYSPAKAISRSQAVIICPGGGYHSLSIDAEGRKVAEWFEGQGFHAFVLKYRLPQRGETKYAKALEDIQRSIRIIRSHSADWGIDKIGIVGFSAGGHLAATAGAQWKTSTYMARDAIDHLSARPDFICLIYPAFLMKWDETSRSDILSPELKPNQDSPPTFIVNTQDDNYPLRYCNAYIDKLAQAKVPVEFHFFEQGGHGYGVSLANKLPVGEWPRLFVKWTDSCCPPSQVLSPYQTAIAKIGIPGAPAAATRTATTARQ